MVNRKTHALAKAAGATVPCEFALFDRLRETRQAAVKLVKEWKGGTIPAPRGMLLRYDFLLKRGRFFRPQPRPKGLRRGRAKQCYGNSFDLTVIRPELAYCEGFVVVPLGRGQTTDVEHGWCATADGWVIDLTLKEPGLAYFGVAYTEEEIGDGDALPVIDELLDAWLLSKAR
ncbi:MAG TPA: hypothetical protein VGI40_21510 [Pirellulaceae bacterium]|jgi:hypothetical protein